LLKLRSKNLVIPRDWLVRFESTEIKLHLILLRRNVGLLVIERCHGRILKRDVRYALRDDRATVGCGARENMGEVGSTRVLRSQVVREGIGGRLDRRRSHRIHVFRTWQWPHRYIVLIIAQTFPIVLLVHSGDGGQDFNLTIENHREGLTTDGFLDTMVVGTITPLIKLPAEGISFKLQETKLTRSHGAVATRGMDVSDRRIDNCRLGRAANLGKIGKESGEVLYSMGL
jgi:hypothetical protein